MAVKEWFRRMRPVQLYVMLAMTTLFFLAQLVMSHMAHALTLLVDSCHMLCNLIALTGCIITVKYGSTLTSSGEERLTKQAGPTDQIARDGEAKKQKSSSACSGNGHQHSHQHGHQHSHQHAPTATERRLRNTFGWARIDVLVMLICGVFLASLCFSLVVEALQELVHIDHHDAMHHPIAVMCVGAAGLLLNGLCYLLIGGYTFHQGSFLHVTASGEVVLDHSMHKDAVQRGQRRLSKQTRQPTPTLRPAARQGFKEMFRDVVGCLFVIFCSVIVYFTDQSVAKFADPILAIISAVLLLVLSYPYMKESGAILLQTIPDHINIVQLRTQLIREFPDIVNVHDLHVWQLTQNKVVSTVHIIFLNPKDYARIILEVTNFFYDQGITQVTIQPEFFKAENECGSVELLSVLDHDCLVKCTGELCLSRLCCSSTQSDLSLVVEHSHSHVSLEAKMSLNLPQPSKTTLVDRRNNSLPSPAKSAIVDSNRNSYTPPSKPSENDDSCQGNSISLPSKATVTEVNGQPPSLKTEVNGACKTGNENIDKVVAGEVLSEVTVIETKEVIHTPKEDSEQTVVEVIEKVQLEI